MLIRYKLVFLSLVLVLLGTGCSDEIKKKEAVVDDGSGKDPCAQEAGDDRFFCLETALQIPDGESCANAPNSASCGKEKFLNDGYGGFVYPQPVMAYFNELYAHYVRYYHGRYGELPEYRHFGELFGLIYNDGTELELPEDIVADMLPVGIVTGGTATAGVAQGTAYYSESCALCHFNIANDGFYRFGVPNTYLKYGGLKIAFNRFVCYAESQGEYDVEKLNSDCTTTDVIDKLEEPRKSQCKAYQAFQSSNGNASLLSVWRNDEVFSDAKRKEMLDGLMAQVDGSTTACGAVAQLQPAYSDLQIQELAKWDGVRANGSLVDADASRIDRFYHGVMTADSSARGVDDGVHVPVKIPVLGNLVPNPDAVDTTQLVSGAFLGSGVVGSLQHYVRLHAALVGGNNTAGMENSDLAPLTNFLVHLNLPKPAVAQSTLDSASYANGKALFESRGCVDCHDIESTADQAPVQYTQTAKTDFTYTMFLDSARSGTVVSAIAGLTTSDTFLNPQGGLKPPHLQGLWVNQSFLHNGMAFSLQNLFCLTNSNRQARDAVYSSGDQKGKGIHEAPFLDSGHTQTCGDLSETQRNDMIIYLLTL